MNKWDVYLANVPFEDVQQAKVRPVIILDGTTVIVDCIKMTSHLPRRGEYQLKFWQAAGLKKPTTVRLSKRLALERGNFIKYIGRLHPVDILAIQNYLSL